jgi:hypothetical protein
MSSQGFKFCDLLKKKELIKLMVLLTRNYTILTHEKHNFWLINYVISTLNYNYLSV